MILLFPLFKCLHQHITFAPSQAGIKKVKLLQDLVGAGGPEAPKNIEEVIAQLASRLARWDDRYEPAPKFLSAHTF